jgi:hypothetical protein
MRKSKFTETQIASILKQADAGVPVKDLCRQAGSSMASGRSKRTMCSMHDRSACASVGQT